jgi:hypothetical protein
MAELILLEELKNSLGIPDTTVSKDALYQRCITAASTAVLNYTDRDFGSDAITEQRTYEWDGSGYVDIDDAATITAVTLSLATVDTVVATDQWRAEPLRGAVFTYVIVPSRYGFGSPEMGFTRNLDVYADEYSCGYLPPLVKVDGTWGWPTVPDDVKQATIWTAAAMSENVTPFITESIENYSRTVGTAPRQAIPDRAKDLLSQYQRQKV